MPRQTPQPISPQTRRPYQTPVLSWTTEPSALDIADAGALLSAAAAADGVEPVSEAAVLRLQHPGQAPHLLVRDEAGVLLGYAGLDTWAQRPTGEFVVHPDHRCRGVGMTMLSALLDRISGPLWIWAHGEHPAALRLAERAGLDRRRELLQLRRPLRDPIPPRALPEGLALRSFVPGQDEPAVVRVNNRAFAWHPEQGRWAADELVLRETQPWFDPKGFLLAVDAQDALHGFHWTKVHPDGLGEVYVIGGDPDAQGTGLGGALIVAGLEHLRDRGVPEVMLYVESDNAVALQTYRRLGFRRHHTDVEFLRDAHQPGEYRSG
ncbi:MAG TPA: mycothiol synthase [Pseudonocardiaceae bacterium]|nr:mycothiol synthase [Pseudonocardiaceae bacterium]